MSNEQTRVIHQSHGANNPRVPGVWLSNLAISLLLGTCLVGCYVEHDAIDAESSSDAGVTSMVWVVVHPSNAPLGAGLFLFDESRQEVVRRLPLPDIVSPHALAWDGESLWLGGHDEQPAVYQLDPTDGREISQWPGVATEGIAFDGTSFWYSSIVASAGVVAQIHNVDVGGTSLGALVLPDVLAMQDLVSANGAFYYLANDELDRIVRVDPTTGASVDLVRGVHVAPSSLGFDGTYIAVAVDGRILRFDVASGELVRDDPFDVPGWITAIAFVR